MKIATGILIEELKNQTQKHLAIAQSFKKLSLVELQKKASAESWSILECLKHLNLYADFYLPEISHQIKNNSSTSSQTIFKSGWLGNYFALSMLPKENFKKMKTFKDKNPNSSPLTAQVIEEFIQQQYTILNLLEEAKQVNLMKIKISISISKWIKLRLGDTFRFLINHNYRHLVQAQKIIN